MLPEPARFIDGRLMTRWLEESSTRTLMGDLESLANRGYTDGFFVRHHSQELQRYHDSASTTQRQMFVGEILQTG